MIHGPARTLFRGNGPDDKRAWCSRIDGRDGALERFCDELLDRGLIQLGRRLDHNVTRHPAAALQQFVRVGQFPRVLQEKRSTHLGANAMEKIACEAFSDGPNPMARKL